MDPNSEKRISQRNVLTQIGTFQDYSKTLMLVKEKMKKIMMIGLGNRGHTLIFMFRHFDETMAILSLH